MPIKNFGGTNVILLSTINDIELDAVEQVSVQKEALVTRNPTETGKNVSDHIVNLPVVINLSGRFVDTPFGDSVFSPASTFVESVVAGLSDGLSVQRWRELEDLRASKITFTVVIQQGVYENMVFRSLTSPRGKGDGTSLRFQAELIELFTTDVLPAVVGGAAVSADVDHTAPFPVSVGVHSASVWKGSIT